MPYFFMLLIFLSNSLTFFWGFGDIAVSYTCNKVFATN